MELAPVHLPTNPKGDNDHFGWPDRFFRSTLARDSAQLVSQSIFRSNDPRWIELSAQVGRMFEDCRVLPGHGDRVFVLLEIARAHPLVLDDPPITVHVDELADSSVNLFCRPWVKTADYWAVHWDLTRQAKERFDAEGISIPFPQRDVHLYPTAPPQER